MGTSAALGVLGTVASTGFGMARAQQQQSQQARAARQQQAYNERVYANRAADRRAATEAAQRDYTLQSRQLAETAARQRQASLLTFQREERERLRRLRQAAGTLSADASARGIGGGGAAAAIQRGLEREADAIAREAEADRARIAGELGRAEAYDAYALERQRYDRLNGLARDGRSAALRQGYERRRNLLDLADGRARARLGLMESVTDRFLTTASRLSQE